MTAFLSGEMRDTVELVSYLVQAHPENPKAYTRSIRLDHGFSKKCVPTSRNIADDSSSLAENEPSCSGSGLDPAQCGSRVETGYGATTKPHLYALHPIDHSLAGCSDQVG